MRRKDTTYIEVETKPDALGRQRFCIYWFAKYHAFDSQGKPTNENFKGKWRGQYFFAKLKDHLGRYKGRINIIEVM